MPDSEHPPSVSIKFDPVGRVHYFLLPEVDFKPPLRAGEAVVVARGGRKAFGTVARSVPALVQRSAPPPPSNVVLRRASDEDITARLTLQHREREIRRIATLKIKECGLSMKLVRVEQQYDGSRLTFYFTAEERVDFRALVRELAAEFRCRIEMRQIGARDEAKLLGGYGTCGRPLCCTTWLKGFEPVSIKMAKRQHLSLNPSRLSGLCGRLKCCLRYELPNAAGEQFAGCAHEGSCSRSAGNGCGSGGCGSGACGGCG
jgi:cell fate regulator YaaT (PSP1 superfamily)